MSCSGESSWISLTVGLFLVWIGYRMDAVIFYATPPNSLWLWGYIGGKKGHSHNVLCSGYPRLEDGPLGVVDSQQRLKQPRGCSNLCQDHCRVSLPGSRNGN